MWLTFTVMAAMLAAGRSNVEGNNEQSNSTSYELGLLHDLLDAYKERGTAARPLRDTSPGQKVQVYMGMRLMDIDLDEAHQLMKTSAWLRMGWYDEWLGWDPENYGGIRGISLPHDQIWSPDIYLVNTHHTGSNSRQPYVQVNSSGYVFWTPHYEFTSGCLIDATNYPFDIHVCEMWFQSIGQPSSRVDLQLYPKSPLDLSTLLDSYKESQDWEILDNSTMYVEKSHTRGMVLVYSNRPCLMFSVTLQRRPTFQAWLVLTPCILLPILTAAVFLLPPDRPDRLSLAMGLLSCCVILLLLVNNSLPPTPASAPSLSLYYSINLVMILMSVVLTAIVVNLFRRSDSLQPVPKWLQRAMSSVLCSNLCLTSVMRKGLQKESDKDHCQCVIMEQDGFSKYRGVDMGESAIDSAVAGTRPLVQAIDRYTERLEQIIPAKQSSLATNRQWKTVAAVLDRIFFIMFLVFDVVVFVMKFPWP